MYSATKPLFIAITLIIYLIGTTLAVRICYYCSPKDEGCDDPTKNDRWAKPCVQAIADDSLPHGRVLKQQRLKATNPDTIEYMCATVLIKNSNSTLTGFYRTCLVNSPDVDDCELLKDEFKNRGFGTPLDCSKCEEELCNNKNLRDMGSSSSEIGASVLLYSVISFFFVTCVF